MDVVFHSHLGLQRASQLFLLPFLGKQPMEVFQGQQPEAPTRLGDLGKSAWQGYLWIPKSAPGIAGRRSRRPPPRRRACVPPREHPTARPWPASPRWRPPRDQEPGHPSPAAGSALRPRGLREWPPKASSSLEKTEAGQGLTWVWGKSRSFPRLSLQVGLATLSSGHPTEGGPELFHDQAWPDWLALSPHYSRDGVRLVQTRGGSASLLVFPVFSMVYLHRPTIWILLWLSIYYKRK